MVKRLFPYLKPYKKYVILAPICMLLEVGSELITPKLMTILIENGVGQNNTAYITGLGILMFFIAIIGIIGGVGCLYCAVNASQRAGNDIRRDLFKKIESFSFHNIDHFKTPSLITRLTNDITQIQMVVQMSLRMLIRAPLLCIGSIFMAFTINAKLTLIFFGAMVVLGFVLFLILRYAMPYFSIMQTKLDKVNTVMRECLAGIRVIKAFVRGDYEIEKFQKVNRDYKATSIRAFGVMISIIPAMMMIINCAIVAILWMGAHQVQLGVNNPEDIMALITYLNQMMMSLMMAGMMLVFFSRAFVSLQRIFEVIDHEVDIKDPETEVLPEHAQGKVQFSHVTFRYQNGTGDAVLEDIDFTAKPGETIAILGETGSGKTTFVSMIPRLYDATKGEVYVDDVNVKDYNLHDLRKKVAIVLQDTILFSGTIRDNIKWGKEDATEEEVIAAAKAAQAHDFIMELPDQYDTELGQRGVNVSGGQKQRISIARALIQDPDILIFDDSTSALDNVTEKKLQHSLKVFRPNCTKFIIAQRISSVMHADRIFVLNGGKIVASGQHEELLKTSPDYQEIYASQNKKGVMLDE